MSLFDIAKLESELKNLEKETIKENFWNNQENSTKILEEIKEKKKIINAFTDLKNDLNNLEELSELVEMENDEDKISNINLII